MPKQQKLNKNKVSFTRLTAYLLSVIGLLVLLSGALGLQLHDQNLRTPQKIVSVNLGAMQYRFSNGHAIKRTDETVTSLRSFLTTEGKKDIELGCTATYYNVVRYTTDQSQVLLNYGCVYPNANMYAVRDSTTSDWRLISPTNHFDDLGVPECTYLAQNHISTQIAPVCTAMWPSAHETFVVR